MWRERRPPVDIIDIRVAAGPPRVRYGPAPRAVTVEAVLPRGPKEPALQGVSVQLVRVPTPAA